MITSSQLQQLAKQYQIDEFTILREYLQLVFLSHLYQQKEGRDILFKGGTALRLLYNSSRFSEDLDFSTTLDKKTIKNLIKKLEKKINMEIKKIKIFSLHSGKDTERYRIIYQGQEIKYPLTIRLDFHRIKKIDKSEVSPLITNFPLVIFPLITHLDIQALFEEKIRASIDRAKARDVFDIWYLLNKGCQIESKKIKEKLIKKIKIISEKELYLGLNKFLPKSQREIIKMLKMLILQRLR